ncbi:MAG: hypothetical protein AAGC88_00350 [Bacteroidota bacterium]
MTRQIKYWLHLILLTSISVLLSLGSPHSNPGSVQEETEIEVKTNHLQYVQERRGYWPKKKRITTAKTFAAYESPFEGATELVRSDGSAYLLYQQWLFYG